MPLFLEKKRGLKMLYEVKKILRPRTILLLLVCNILSCALFYVQNKGVENAANTGVLEELYAQIGGELTQEKMEQIEQLKRDTDEVLVRESGGWMLFDGYYCRWLDPKRKQWGLILSVFLIAVLLGSCEPSGLFKVLQITKKGKRGIFREKFRTAVILAVLLALLYGAEEYGISSSFYAPHYLNAPVQSISCLANVRLSVSIRQWLILTTGIRSVIAALFSGAVCAMLYCVQNYCEH